MPESAAPSGLKKSEKKRQKRQKGKRRGPGRPFVKGQPGGPGRTPGVPNKVTLEQKEFTREFLMSDEYRSNLKSRVLAGEAQALEIRLHDQAFGKPKETTAIEGGGGGFNIVLMGPVRDPLAEPGEEGVGGGRPVPPQKALPPAKKAR